MPGSGSSPPEGPRHRPIEGHRGDPHPPEKVWRALTEPELLAAWLMGTDMRPAHAAAHDDARFILMQLVLAVLVVASWALRPEGRKLKRG